MTIEADDLPPMRQERPTLPFDLSEYARVHTGPRSWTADPREACAPTLLPNDVPQVAIAARDYDEHALGHKEGFVLSHVDGASTVDELCEVTGLCREETLAVLNGLHDRGVVTVEAEPLASSWRRARSRRSGLARAAHA